MIRSRPFLVLMHRLALVATLLMVLAPLVSRCLPAAVPPAQAMCTRADLREGIAASAGAHANHAMDSAEGMRGDGPRADARTELGLHGFACDYCGFAARLLPWLAAALLVLPRISTRAPGCPLARFAPAPRVWPAHAPRGPPLHV